jgi:hypothetical protein
MTAVSESYLGILCLINRFICTQSSFIIRLRIMGSKKDGVINFSDNYFLR